MAEKTIQGYNMDNHELIVAALEKIESELDRVMWNIHQEEYSSPFMNTGNSFKCDTFEVSAYDWDWDMEEESGEAEPKPNFKWRNFEFWWYKYLGRGDYANREISNDELNEMLNDCLRTIIKYEKNHESPDFSSML